MRRYARLALGGGNVVALFFFAAYGALTAIALLAFGYTPSLPLTPLLLGRLYLYAASIVYGSVLLIHLWKMRPSRPLARIPSLVREWRVADRLVAGLPLVMIFGAFIDQFGMMKSLIPKFRPYGLDPLLASIDVSLFGKDPWRILQPVLGHPFITYFLSQAYVVWGVALFTVTAFAASLIERPSLRRQFILAYFLIWIILGTGLAILLASVGPCFYESIYGDGRFAALMDYLRAANHTFPLAALDGQKVLLHWYKVGDIGAAHGISAMPSLHVSMAVLMAIYGWRVWSPSLYVSVPFAFVIWLGSVHLGFHYAVDGLVAVVLTPAIWWASGWVVRRRAAAALTAATPATLPA